MKQFLFLAALLMAFTAKGQELVKGLVADARVITGQSSSPNRCRC